MIVAALGLLPIASPMSAATAPFAIACTGRAEFSRSAAGEVTRGNYDVPRQIYVLNQQAGRVQRAMEPRQQFEDVCSGTGRVTRVDFSPGLIIVHSEGSGSLCDFKVDRRTGEAEFFSHLGLPGGDFHEMEWKMTCDRTDVPVFDTSRNRF